jgi:ABC-2 type transport system ATP-binding protein
MALFAEVPGVTNLVQEGRSIRMLVTGPIAPVVRLAAQRDLVDFVSREPTLEEVFLAEYETTAPSAAPAAPAEPAEPAAGG